MLVEEKPPCLLLKPAAFCVARTLSLCCCVLTTSPIFRGEREEKVQQQAALQPETCTLWFHELDATAVVTLYEIRRGGFQERTTTAEATLLYLRLQSSARKGFFAL